MRKERVKLRSFGNKLKYLRKEKRMTQQSFADALGISLETVKNWEQGYTYPTIDTLVIIAKFFKCDFDFLLGEQDTPNKVYKHFAEETGLTEDVIRNFLYFCRNDKSIMQYLLDDIELLFYMDYIINADHSKMRVSANNEAGEKAEIKNSELYRLDKMDLYRYLCDFVDKCRKQKGLEAI